MKLSRWLSAIAPSFTKAGLLDEITNTRKELKEDTLPVLASIAKIKGKQKFKDEWVRDIDGRFDRRVNIHYSGNFLNGINDSMQNGLVLLDILEKIIMAKFEQDILRDAMTIVRANTIQFLESITFATRYTQRLLVAVLSMEDLAAGNADAANDLRVGEMKWIETNFMNYTTCLELLSLKENEVEKRFAELPDMTVNQDSVASAEAVIGVSKIDPFRFGLIPVSLNPLYYFGMWSAEQHVRKLNLAKERKRMLEFKLLQLEQTESGKRDARLESQIEYIRKRIEKLAFMLEEEGMGDGTN